MPVLMEKALHEITVNGHSLFIPFFTYRAILGNAPTLGDT